MGRSTILGEEGGEGEVGEETPEPENSVTFAPRETSQEFFSSAEEAWKKKDLPVLRKMAKVFSFPVRLSALRTMAFLRWITRFGLGFFCRSAEASLYSRMVSPFWT